MFYFGKGEDKDQWITSASESPKIKEIQTVPPLAGDAVQGQSTHKHTHMRRLIAALAA